MLVAIEALDGRITNHCNISLQQEVGCLTTEWLPWLQTMGSRPVHLIQPQYADSPQNICEGVITNVLHSCSKELVTR